MDSEQSLPSALGHPGGLACQVPGRAWLRPPRTRTGRLASTSGRVACQRHPIPRHEIGSENRCRWTLRMCMASHIYEYTQQTTHRVATNTTRRPLFHRAPEDEDDRGAHSKAKEFILGISVCCLCFLKLVNLDLDLAKVSEVGWCQLTEDYLPHFGRCDLAGLNPSGRGGVPSLYPFFRQKQCFI